MLSGLARRRPISQFSRIDPLYRQTAMGIAFGLVIAIILASALSAMVPPSSGSGAPQTGTTVAIRRKASPGSALDSLPIPSGESPDGTGW